MAKPGVLDKLPEIYKETAAVRIAKVAEYFRHLGDSNNITDWLDYSVIDQFPPNEDELDREIEYYQFKETGSNVGNRYFLFHSSNKRFQRMIKELPAVLQAV